MKSLQRFKTTLQASLETGEVLKKQIFQDWDASVNYEAAKIRLNLVRRYEDQYDRLDAEFANLRISQFWLARRGGEEVDDLLLAYVELLAPYIYQRNLYTELLRWCEDGLRVCERSQRNPASLLLLKGRTQNALGQWDEARVSYQEAIETSTSVDPSIHARAVLALGQLQFNRGDYVTALGTLTKAEKLLSEQPDYELLASVHSERAAYYLNRGDVDKALALYLEADQIRSRAGTADTPNLLMLGVVYRKKKDYERATMYLQQLLEYGEAHHNKSAIATAAHHLAWGYCILL